MHTLISDTYRSLALASMRRERHANAPGRTRPRAVIIDDGARIRIDSLNGAPAPLDSTRYLVTTHHRRGPALSTVMLCACCASVAYRATVSRIAVGNVARTITRRRMSFRAITSGRACDACGRTDLPYGERLVHDPPDRLV